MGLLGKGAHRGSRSPNPVGFIFCLLSLHPHVPCRIRHLPLFWNVALEPSLVSLPPVWTFQSTLCLQPSTRPHIQPFMHVCMYSLSKYVWRGSKRQHTTGLIIYSFTYSFLLFAYLLSKHFSRASSVPCTLSEAKT